MIRSMKRSKPIIPVRAAGIYIRFTDDCADFRLALRNQWAPGSNLYNRNLDISMIVITFAFLCLRQ